MTNCTVLECTIYLFTDTQIDLVLVVYSKTSGHSAYLQQAGPIGDISTVLIFKTF